jgi:hypothetical protein
MIELTVQPELNALVFEDAQAQKAQTDFDVWINRWRKIAWSTKKDETELPAFINSDTRASELAVQDANK